MNYNKSHPTFIQQKNARRGSESLAYILREGKLVKLKKAQKKGKCYFCSRSVRVNSTRVKNFCRACLDLVEVL